MGAEGKRMTKHLNGKSMKWNYGGIQMVVIFLFNSSDVSNDEAKAKVKGANLKTSIHFIRL